MKGFAIVALAALVSACATPTLTYTHIPPGHGNIEGHTVVALPLVYLEIVPTTANAEGAFEPPTFTPHYVENPDATFTVEPQDTFFALTEIAPSYRASTANLTAMGVQTFDRSADAAETLATAIGLVGDATFLSAADARTPAEAISCRGLHSRWMWFATNDQASQRDPVLSFSTEQCRIRARVGNLPSDAVSVTAFRERWAAGGTSHVMLTPACRLVTLEYTLFRPLPARGRAPDEATRERQAGHFRWIGYLPDPNHLRLSPLPRDGVLTTTNVCDMPSVDRGESPPPTMAGWLSGIVKPFRN